MKSHFSFISFLIVFLLFFNTINFALACVTPVEKNAQVRELKLGYYVVVGAFNVYENVQRYTKGLCVKGHPCDFAFSEIHNRYYSYIFYSNSIQLAKEKVAEVRNISGFADAWILLVGQHAVEKRLNEKMRGEMDSLLMSKDDTRKVESYKKEYSKTHLEYSLMVRTFDVTNKEINASVKVLTLDKGILLKSMESRKKDAFLLPKDQPHQVEIKCESFGYRQKFIVLDLANPITDSTSQFIKFENNQLVVDFSLEALQKGDIMVMYNVFFFPNTNILRTKSTLDLEQLLELLKKNENYKVKIHGHTNGSSNGEITTLPDNCNDFFNPSETILTSGNSLRLSELRAETIRLYLIKNGIEPWRLHIKGWGGKKMLYKENSPQYQYNVRVEVEILED